MTDRTCRTIIISVIWIALGTFLTFGLPELKTNGNADDQLFFFVAAIFISICGGVGSTAIIWFTRRPREMTHGFEVIQPTMALNAK
jgi:hypothetical protein